MPHGHTRVAFAFGHRGDTFHGSQVQPDLRTVQGSLQETFRELGFIKRREYENQPCILSSRTDAGVHVRMNVACIDLPSEAWAGMGEAGFLNAVNDQLDGDIVVWAACQAPDGWNPRRAVSRTYRFRLEGVRLWNGASEEEFREWSGIFVGSHDFNNFRRMDDVPSTTREILYIEPLLNDGEVIGFEIQGRAFLWNMVRRIASTFCGLSRQDFVMDDVKRAIEQPSISADLGLAPADWLTLWEVEHEEIELHMLARHRTGVDSSTRPPAEKNRRFERWQEIAALEQIIDCHHQWEALIRRGEG